MWLRLGFIAGRVLLRIMIRLAPFLAIGAAGLARRYRWSMYYRAKALPSRLHLSALPAALAGAAAAILILAVALYLLVTHLAPRA